MLLAQVKKITELESYGWVMNDAEEDRKKLLAGVPVKMRNLRRDLALVYPDGSMRAVEYHPTLIRQEDFHFNGNIRATAEKDAFNHLAEIFARAFGVLSK